MTYPNNSEINRISVDFKLVYGGWIYFKITAGEDYYETQFSAVYDPIKSLKKWLEALTIEPYMCGFQYDNEGEEIIWSFIQIAQNTGIFCVAKHNLDIKNDIYIVSYADRKQVVRNIYLSFWNFFKSEQYKSEEWENEYLGDNPELFQSNIVETYLTNG
jgi:hypothetical protein